MKTLLKDIILISTGFLLLTTGDCLAQKTSERSVAELFDFRIVSHFGDTLIAAQLIGDNRGKVLYIDFWGRWCAACRSQIPYSEKLIGTLPQSSFQMLYFSADRDHDSWQNVNTELHLENRSWRIITEDGEKAQNAMKINSIPFYVIVDSQGKVLLNAPWPQHPKSEKVLKRLLSE